MRYALLLTCPDRPGIVAAVGGFVADVAGNIVEADQHTDAEAQLFLQRVAFDADAGPDALEAAFAPIARRFGMRWRLARLDGDPAPVVVLASREGHCATDLLGRFALGELPGELRAVVSNHEVLAGVVERFGVPFVHLPVDDDRSAQEARLGTLLEELAPEVVVLARYMRILPPALVAQWPERMLNVHHSFLPAFAGARPYHQAHERGVKVIGATAHYVTAELDAGPIVAQMVLPVSHRDDPAALARRGRDLERVVLAEALRLHLEHRVLVYGTRTAVFD